MVQKQLIYNCKNGDRKAQKELYDRYSNTLFGCCLKYAPNYQEAQDILQDSFLTIFKKIGQFEDAGSFEGWCKRITINVALQRYRGTKVYRLEDGDCVIDEVLEIEEPDNLGMQEMLLMIQQLPDRYRLVFSLYTLDGYGHKEIADMMQITEGTSKSNLSRARQKLQHMIIKWREDNTCNAS
ncbi:RNA polymerase sigma factor [Nonlabens antarcticus]|uniref:RNA polymerase sigma factor n=1 Tax=Nonlabens antarcticus TaxID=392714 RepID=UPI0018917A5A|nr:sigma-70 family RNA polymerase sigma factor [Nonlabens antarcticus]